jgi:uncharacterized repeat protein (TIGR03803 family)
MKAQPPRVGLMELLAVVVLTLTLTQTAWPAPKYQVLHNFSGTDGAGLWGAVTLDQQGRLYGAASGARGGKCSYGCVFQLTPHSDDSWTEADLYSFRAGHDGNGSDGDLILDSSGDLYGTTVGGGRYGSGTVFKLTHGSSGWAEAVLYSFGTHSDDGGNPTAGLVMDKAGNLYGATPKGSPWSTVFELSPGSSGWKETVLYRFCMSMPVCEDGTAPYAGLILDSSGNLYGTTGYGGVGCAAEGCGTVYELERTSIGWQEKVLHSFDNNGADGVEPGWGPLFMDTKGDLYGTTASGGAPGPGTVFRLTKGSDGHWRESILYSFRQGSTGSAPNTGVVMDKAGNLYGTTDYGGDPYCDCGVIYKLSPRPKGKWSYTVLHEFGIGSDGGLPEGNLVIDSKGNLYGGTVLGGTYGGGVVFELTP